VCQPESSEIFFRLYNMLDERFYGKFLAVMIQYLTFGTEKGLHVSLMFPGRKDQDVYKYKGFDSAQCGDSMSTLEAMVNAWMESEHPRIRHVCQSMRGEHVLLSFVYEVTRELEQRVTTQAQTTPMSRYFEDDYVDERPTGSRIPVAPPPVH